MPESLGPNTNVLLLPAPLGPETNSVSPFVLLEHQVVGRPVHWDWMFACPGEPKLRTWSTAVVAETLRKSGLPADRLSDHRLAYLWYEGPVMGMRGLVQRADSGYFQILADHDDVFRVQLRGDRWRGVVEFERCAANEESRDHLHFDPPGRSAEAWRWAFWPT